MKRLIFTTIIAFFGGIIGAYVFHQNKMNDPNIVNQTPIFSNYLLSDSLNIPINYPTSYKKDIAFPNENFVLASQKSTNSVVFIQTLSEIEYRTGGWMDWFFEPRSSQRVGSGSGVVFEKNGYIITNNHVVDDADIIKVIAGKRNYEAKLVGKDPNSDLAVIKINSSELSVIDKGDSEKVAVGEWVLAVGNPFNLTSTVTAGIVSAKGRNINILKEKFPIESFIQTDAAINPGNSGGALVNIKGELIGINTAILSRTGSYAGYGFAIPINIVKKVFYDIVTYGIVQKAFIGASFIDLDGELAEELKIDNLQGVIITEIEEDGAAEKAGLKKWDILRKMNHYVIKNKSEVEELIAKSYPGDSFTVAIEKNGKVYEKNIVLTNSNGEEKIIKRNIYISKELEASFEKVSKVEKNLLRIQNGVKVIEYDKKGLFSKLGIPKDFIITRINHRQIDNPKELDDILANIRGRFDIIGITSKGRKVYYPFRR